jgi:hypothetical protein
VNADDFQKLGYERGQEVTLTIGTKPVKVPFVRTFADVPLRKPLLYVDSRGRVALAVNQGSFAAEYAIKPPVRIFIPKKNRR